MQKKGRFGQFATSWFSKTASGPTVQPERESGHRTPTGESGTQATSADFAIGQSGSASKEKKKQRAIEYLTPRILKTARLYFSSSGFYYSYDHDLSRSLSHFTESNSHMPLWKQFEPQFFWNRHLIGPFIDAGQDSLVLPLIQGFVGQRQFSVSQSEAQQKDAVEGTELTDFNDNETHADVIEHDFTLMLISRRSTKRAGLRYLRRGVDDQGNVANCVESEQMLSSQDLEKTFSLVQVRGSMPLFFSQSPYSFKPTPVMFGSELANQAAFRAHFETLASRYGSIQAVSLVDKHGTEVGIGEAYERNAQFLNESSAINSQPLRFEWFDFHGQCKGMRFENVSILMDTLHDFLTSAGYTVTEKDKNRREQSGALRVNCMDCLDRTNVVQSAVAGWALQQQLGELGLAINLQTDSKTQWFNTLWADNGDAISKQYAGTSALKGDFTRTRKRNWAGALSDFSLTINRYYNNIFGDYFLQTNIDYFLGADHTVFEEFETDMMSHDYALDMSRIRQGAIDTCVKIVLEDPAEDLLSAWTLSCPRQSDTLRSTPFEECVLLLTSNALYFCRFDWDTEKVGSFERVELLDVKEMWRGPYVTTGVGAAHLDETRNYGFVLRYTSHGPATVRTNTRSMSVSEGTTEDKNDGKREKSTADPIKTRMLAFKALPPRHSTSKAPQDEISALSEVEATRKITDELHGALGKAMQRDRRESFRYADVPRVQERAVVSAAEARKSTSYVESLGYSLKKFVWS
jgi:hypothetical protein